jgi:hypothetical protein
MIIKKKENCLILVTIFYPSFQLILHKFSKKTANEIFLNIYLIE